jgi:hypothetical protein
VVREGRKKDPRKGKLRVALEKFLPYLLLAVARGGYLDPTPPPI